MTCNIIQFLKVLSHPQRLCMTLDMLRRERSVGELAHSLGVSASTASQHLSRLRDSGVVTGTRRAQKIYYRIADECPVVELVKVLSELFVANDCNTPRSLAS